MGPDDDGASHRPSFGKDGYLGITIRVEICWPTLVPVLTRTDIVNDNKEHQPVRKSDIRRRRNQVSVVVVGQGIVVR